MTLLLGVCACVAVHATHAAQTDAEKMVSSLLGGSNAPAAAVTSNAAAGIAVPLPPPSEGRAADAATDDEPEVGVDTSTGRKGGPASAEPVVPGKEPKEVSIFGTGAETSLALKVSTAVSTGAVAGSSAVTSVVDKVEEEQRRILAAVARPGMLVGKVTDHAGRPLRDVKMSFMAGEMYKTMPSMPSGSFGFSVPASNEYYLTATLGNQFYYTNLFLVPAEASMIVVRLRLPRTVYGQLNIDGKPAQRGLLLRLVSPAGELAGGVVLSNGMFHIRDLTPGKYTVVFERRKQFIDPRINESRFYYLPIVFTAETMRISFERDRRTLSGTITMDGLPQRTVDALVILKDARTGGKLIHREAYTYTDRGRFVFNHVQPGTYTIQAIHSNREWHTPVDTVVVDPADTAKSITINVTKEGSELKRLEDLRNQFMTDEK